jgi:hypothetical protein
VRFAPLQRVPARSSSMMIGFASPDRLRPQVFSTSRRFSNPPRACRPCFMPDPLMGLNPSELSSYRVAVRRLRRRSPLDVGPCSSPSRNACAARRRPKALSNHRAARCELIAEATLSVESVRSRRAETLSKPDAPPVPRRPKPLWAEWLGSPHRGRNLEGVRRAVPLSKAMRRSEPPR